jgi:uncharacterized BrkB/YihY/UPF0761 family membrane protein
MAKDSKIGGFSFIIIAIISFLYILLVTKFAEIISVKMSEEGDEEGQVGLYVMIIYFVSIIGIICGYLWLNDNNNKTPNWILRWSISIGGVIILINALINYWDFLGDYSKLSLIALSITSIIYYLYKYY